MSILLKGSIIPLDIKTIGINGEGIGYYNKVAVFVKGAIPKEKIFAKIEEVNKNYYVASIDSFIVKSNRRVEPFCKFYNDCGACNIQHIKMNEQLKIKRNILINSLKRYTKKLDVEKTNISLTKSTGVIAYRNKSQKPFRETSFGLALGLYHENSNKFIYVDECLIENEIINKINSKTLQILRREKETTTKNGGVLEYLCVRALEDSKEAQVTFVLSAYKDIYQKIAKELIEDVKEIKGVFYSIKPKDSISIYGPTANLLEGRKYIRDNLLDLKVNLSPKSFYQLNKKASELLYEEILNSELKEDDIVFDGYSGIGVLGLLIAKKTKHVYSVDINSDSIKNARIIARDNKISNITFYSDRIENRFPNLLKEGIKPNVVVLDPPRSGLDDKVIETLNHLKAERIYYISCNTSTLAKNLDKLLDVYGVESITPYDFFTETANVETVCLLTNRTGNTK